jgi:hypothetical protein
MTVESFAVVRSQGFGRGKPVTESSSAASTGAASEAVAQSRRLAMWFLGQSTTAHDVTSTKISRDVSRESDGAVLVAFEGVVNIGVPWRVVVDDQW